MVNIIPRFIQDKYNDNILFGNFKAIVMLIKISGLTTIVNEFLKENINNEKCIIEVLNNVYKLLVSQIYDSGAYISGFIGNKIIVIFDKKIEPSKVIQSAISITNCFKNSQSLDNKKSEIFPKTAISYGEVDWGIIGDDERKTYYFRGTPIISCDKIINDPKFTSITLDKQIVDLLTEKDTIHLEKLDKTYYKLINIQRENTTEIVSSLDKKYYTGVKTSRENIAKVVSLPLYCISREIAGIFVPEHVLGYKHYGEYRNIVSIFVSIKGVYKFTKLNNFMGKILRELYFYKGFCQELSFRGRDLILLFNFGAPLSYENNIMRALYFTQYIRGEFGENIKAGISFGKNFIGIKGVQSRCSYAIIGDNYETALKLMLKAPWASIWISNEVKSKIEDYYIIKNLPEKEIFDKTLFKPIYELIEENKKISHRQFLGEILQREKELKNLNECIKPLYNNRFAGIVYIYGSAGIGKSRLVYEFTKSKKSLFKKIFLQTDSLSKSNLNPFEYFLQNYFKQSGLYPSKEKKSRFEEIYSNLIKKLKEKDDLELTRPIIKELIRVKSFLGAKVDVFWEDSLYEKINPKLRYENTIYALKELFKAESLIQPIIIFLEDLQWLEIETHSVFDIITKNISDFPILIIATCRLNDDNYKEKIKISGTINQQEIILNPLNKHFTRQLTERTIGNKADKTLISYIYDRTQGNPFYIEQFCMYLSKNNLIEFTNGNFILKVVDIDIPPRIETIVTARLDRLPVELKETVYFASVLGREFNIDVLVKMIDLLIDYIKNLSKQKIPELDINIILTILRSNVVKNKLLRDGEIENLWYKASENKYIFKNIILGKIAYQIQLKPRLKILHKFSAEAIESLYKNEASYCASLAYHYEKAGNLNKTKAYLLKAADYKKDTYNNRESLILYEKLLEYIKDTTDSDELNTVLYVYQCKADILRILGEYNQAISEIKKGIELSKKTNNKEKEINYLSFLAVLYGDKRDFDSSISFSKKAIETAEAIKDFKTISYLFNSIAAGHLAKGNFDEALKFVNKSLSISRNIDYKQSIGWSITIIGTYYLIINEYEKAEEYLIQSLNLYSTMEDKFKYTIALQNISNYYFYQGNYEKEIYYLKKALILSRKIGIKGYSKNIYNSLAYTYAKTNNYLQSLRISMYYLKNIGLNITYDNIFIFISIALILIDYEKLGSKSLLIIDKITKITGLKKTPGEYFNFCFNTNLDEQNRETTIIPLCEYGKYIYSKGQKENGINKLKLAKEQAKMMGFNIYLKVVENFCKDIGINFNDL